MLRNHDNLIKIFKRLIEEDKLSQGYIFFGESQVGKATFAKYLANFLEFGEFEEPTRVLSESLIIIPDTKNSDGSIGIDAVRKIKQFLYSKPIGSKRRTVIVDDADNLTSQAQNAILKIAEEPPQSSLLILVLSNPEALLYTLQSRFQKIYFSRVSTTAVKEFLIKEMRLNAKEAAEIASLSFGRIGRAKTMLLDKEWVTINKEAAKFIKVASSRRMMVKRITDAENKDKIKPFLTELISHLSSDARHNYLPLKAILKRLTFMSQFNVNKRLQLETGLLWTT